MKPKVHPVLDLIGVSPSLVTARDFDSRIRWFKSIYPSQINAPIAQCIEFPASNRKVVG